MSGNCGWNTLDLYTAEPADRVVVEAIFVLNAKKVNP